MPQISAGFNYTSTGANSLVTAGNLNQHVNNAQLQGGAIGEQTNIGIVTGNEYGLIYNSSTGLLNKTQLKNLLLTGNIVNTTDVRSTTGVIEINPATSWDGSGIPSYAAPTLLLRTGNYGNIYLSSGDISISADNTLTPDQGLLSLYGKEGIVLAAGDDIDFHTDVVFSANLKLPVGTTAQRPADPYAGLIRYNSTLSSAETYDGTDWGSLAAIVDSSLTANGYVRLSNGLTLQWGTFFTTGTNNNIPNPQIVTLPVEFASTIVYANTSVDGANSSGGEVAHVDWTTSGKTTKSQLGIYANYAGQCKWFAIGF
jgi:hypothetical protein